MKRINKKILSIVLAAVMTISAFGGYMANMSRVNAAGENPKYIAEVAPTRKFASTEKPNNDSNYLRQSVKFIPGATYTFSCYFYTAPSTDEYKKDSNSDVLVACFDSARGWNIGVTNTSGVYGEVGTMILTFTATEADEWLAFRLVNNSSESYYIWNLKMTVSTREDINFDNPDFSEGEGSWIGWQVRKYYDDLDTSKEWYTAIPDAETSKKAAEYTGHQIHNYDRSIFTWLPDYTVLPGYVWDATNKTLTFESTESFNLSTISDYHLYQEGKAFVGWKKGDTYLSKEEATTEQTYTKGTVIQAEYIDCNSEDNVDFTIRSEEMRTEGTLGLRFVVELSNRLQSNLPGNDHEYGTVVIPSKILDENTEPWTMQLLRTADSEQYYNKVVCQGTWADLTCDGKYKYNDVETFPAVVKAEHKYKILSDRIYYTLCMTGITEAKYDRQYTAKGYIKYVDNNGVDRILYTDYASTSPYLTSNADLKEGKTADILTTITNYVKTQYAAVRTDMENGKEEYALPNGAKKGSNETIYKLTNADNLMVREVCIDAGLSGGKTLEIMHLSDLHMGYMNAYDFADAYPTLLATYNWRTKADGQGKNVSADRTVLKYARTADQIVVTGDTWDYLSKGAAELAHREIWDKYPDTIMTLGNHEISQIVSKTVNETLNKDQIYEKLQESWKHDYLYTTKLLEDKVLIVQLHNAANEFYAEQYEKLSEDLIVARDKGYKVLLFMHEPLVTGNSDDTNVVALWKGDKETYDFYNDKPYSNVYPNKNENTKKVYNLITDNADIIEGVFNGHIHTSFYTEIKGTGTNGAGKVIPQYTSGASYQMNATKIIVK